MAALDGGANILYLQAEIFGLRQDLRELEEQANGAHDSKLFATNWYTLAHTPGDDGSVNKQWQKILLLR
ncbi:hypothetical protein LTS10_012807 [Elasticomyces elasticus]|nr:hypothetical protein LTS10_012807 [Elasticomyces elasticus]